MKRLFIFLTIVVALIEFASAARAVVAGEYHTCVLLNDYSVKCFGSNGHGQLGQGNTDNVGDDPGELGTNLSKINLGTNRIAKSVCAGKGFTCVLVDNNELKCFGKNTDGQLGVGSTNTIGDDPDEMGDNLTAVDFGVNKYAKIVGCGYEHVCAILNDDRLKCFGASSYGELGLGMQGIIGNEPYQMGDNLSTVDLGTNLLAKSVALGQFVTCVLLSNDMVKCFGNNGYGQLGQGHNNPIGYGPNQMGDNLPVIQLGQGKSAKSIATGYSHVCVILNDDNLKCFGYNSVAQLGRGNNQHVGGLPNQMGDNLSVVDLGTNRYAKAVSAGEYHTCVLLDNNVVKCFGHGKKPLTIRSTGQLGLGNTEVIGDGLFEMGDNLSAVDLGSSKTAKAISMGRLHSCVLLVEDETVKCFGYNFYGQSGLGSNINIFVGGEPNEMGDNLSPIDLGEPTLSPTRLPSMRSEPTNCKKEGRDAVECNRVPGCRYVFATNSDFQSLGKGYLKKCKDRGDFGCRAQTDCSFQCRKLRRLDGVCKRRFGW